MFQSREGRFLHKKRRMMEVEARGRGESAIINWSNSTERGARGGRGREQVRMSCNKLNTSSEESVVALVSLVISVPG